ncbi:MULTISPECIES: lycopene cyclase domain-containing protein [unclassified Cryobacterium]|uniref:lycopene cyclase domain-containing protein n=1 Tax=unclassified Cryobacterium TaxID=2649013 RepID=UPI00106A2AE8|nr:MULTISPECIES: lycopene cyclase domain-containing protein [unclassified Cryobacterium]TFD03534.1 lycopene cyclase domain-containing protein [Cryobacterium sp. TMT1-66-1]TFD12797.1 lycopene cyclase domain-containing protein [Cryobacterium sp. TMT1-2-2]
MTYLLLNAVFLAVAALVAAVAALRRLISARFVVRVASALLLTLLLTALFDNLMIGAGLFSYDPEHISGLFVLLAPIEDFAYPLAAAILLPALWTLVGGTRLGQTDD